MYDTHKKKWVYQENIRNVRSIALLISIYFSICTYRKHNQEWRMAVTRTHLVLPFNTEQTKKQTTRIPDLLIPPEGWRGVGGGYVALWFGVRTNTFSCVHFQVSLRNRDSKSMSSTFFFALEMKSAKRGFDRSYTAYDIYDIYHFGRKFKGRLIFMLMFKRSLHFRLKWYDTLTYILRFNIYIYTSITYTYILIFSIYRYTPSLWPEI